MDQNFSGAIWSDRKKKNSSILLFLIGLLGSTQIVFVGAIGISELPVMLLAPYVLYRNFSILRNEGVMPSLYLLFGSMLTLIIGSILNGCFYPFMILKSESILYSLAAHIIIFYILLRGNVRGLRWLLLGFFISGVIKTWYFNPSIGVTEMGTVMFGDEETLASITSPVYWSGKFSGLITTLAGGWAQSFPIPLTILMALGATAFVATTSISGRAAMGGLLAGVLLLAIGRPHYLSLKKFTKRFLLIVTLLVAFMVVLKMVYSFAASHGYLGAEALGKYERQTKTGTGILNILMSGRVECFISARAGLDHPIFGYGVVAEDRKGYTNWYMNKFADPTDYDAYLRYKTLRALRFPGQVETIPTHSHIMSFWLLYGIFGLLFWLYTLFLVFRYFSRYAPSCPYLFGYLAISSISFIWGIFFNPVTNRSSTILPLVCILVVRAIYLRRYDVDPIDAGLVEVSKRRRFKR